ncbi:MAG: hypothetical protein Q8L55_03630 [Phycisphaerales bacterium]|nr:hypothetical protein [Phycisphaerales bacterium]
MQMPRPAVIAALLLPLAGAGCVTPRNDDHALSDGTPLIHNPVVSGSVAVGQADAPSLSGLDRSHWPQTHYSVPQRDVVHQPVYRSRPVSLTSRSAIQRGEYPVPETAAESISDGTRAIQAIEAVLAPLQAMGELVLMVPRAVLMPPMAPARGPTVPVHRVARAAVLTPATARLSPSETPVHEMPVAPVGEP